jgi:peptidoglycan/LPS O-acetylase OafA/YrhL
MTSQSQVDQRQTGFRKDIQGIRGLAVFAVVVFHSGLTLSGGFIGVDIFFVVSGYVITQLLLRKLGPSSRPSLSQFYTRRARRLMPALALMLTVVMLASILLLPVEGQGNTARTGFAATLLNANTYLIVFGGNGYFEGGMDRNPLLNTWSLSVEEQFYLVFPFVVLLGWLIGSRRRPTRRRLAVGLVLAIFGLLSFVLAQYLSASELSSQDTNSLTQRFLFYGPFTRAWEFTAGALLAIAPLGPIRHRATSTWLGVFGLILITLSLFTMSPSTPHPGVATLMPVLGTVLLIRSGATGQPGGATRLMSSSIPVFLGNISYSWYLWHWPLIVFVAFIWPGSVLVTTAAGFLSILVAVASTRWIESPIRYRPHPSRRFTVATLTACVLIPLLAATTLELVHREIRGNSDLNPFAMHEDLLRRCATTATWAEAPEQCTWRVQDSKGLAVLIGDSNAGQFTEGFVSGMNEAGFDASVATMSSCPFIDPMAAAPEFSTVIPATSACESFVSRSLDDLVAAHPSIVIISSSADGYVGSLASGISREDAAAVEARSREWAGGLRQAVIRLENSGSQVFVVQPIPKFQDWRPPIFEPAFRQLLSSGVHTTSRSRIDALAKRLPSVRAQEAALLGTGAKIIDFFDLLCSSSLCSPRTATGWSHRDESHISVAASQALAPIFYRLAKE